MRDTGSEQRAQPLTEFLFTLVTAPINTRQIRRTRVVENVESFVKGGALRTDEALVSFVRIYLISVFRLLS